MRLVRFLIILLIATIVNSGNLLSTISVSSFNVRPDLLLVLLVFFTSNTNMSEAMTASFAIGFAADISGTVMGPYTISYLLVGSLICQMRKVLLTKRMVYQGIAICMAGLMSGVLAQMLIFFKTGQSIWQTYIVLMGTAIYSGLLGPVLWVFLSKISHWLGIRKFRSERATGR